MTRKCTSLDQVRTEIDRLDDSILDLLAERSCYVRQAAALKSRDRIVDPARIEAIIARMRAKAKEHGLDPDIAEAVWRCMIQSFIAYEKKIYDSLHPSEKAG